ncbi:MAG: polysaccharide deacetylase family protein [Acidobacteriota bacterium]|nr:polysaccharide deacetylase family protein [Acidobacteriota bacterium]
MTVPTLKRTVKLTAMRSMRAAGVYSFKAKSAQRSQSLLILCYHGIALRDEHEWAGHLFITPERFRQRLTALRDLKANVLPLGEGFTRLRNGSLPERAVSITFDDGFYDFAQYAAPILSDFAFPSTLYWTTYYSERKLPIINLILDYLLWKVKQASIEFSEQGIANPMPIRNWIERRDVVHKLLAWFDSARLDTAAKDQFARRLANRFQIDYDDILHSRILQIMTPEEAAVLVRSDVDIQLHTHRHRTPVDRGLFAKEIEDNSERIQAITGKTPVHFCYPSGVTDPAFLPWLNNCGVQTATTCQRGFARPDSGNLLLPRVLDDSNMDPVEFEGVVSGLFA